MHSEPRRCDLVQIHRHTRPNRGMLPTVLVCTLVSLTGRTFGLDFLCPDDCHCHRVVRHNHPVNRIRCSGSSIPDLSPLSGDDGLKEVTLDSYRNGNSMEIRRQDFNPEMKIHSLVVKGGSRTRLQDSAFKNLNSYLVTLRVGNEIVFNSTLVFLRGLSNLQRLELENNKQYWTRSNGSHVGSLFSNLGLVRLTHLDMSYCFIYSMSAEVYNGIENITSLDLSGNRLTRVPIAINKLTHLSYLDLSFNDIKSLQSGSFRNLIHLKNLRLAGNEFGELRYDTFAGLERSLRSLDLQMTKQKVIPTHALKNLWKLKNLNISENPFKLMPAYSLEGDYCLHRLDMHDLSVVYHPTMFSGQTKCIRVLSIYRPKLDYIPLEAFTSLTKLEVLEFQGANVKVLKKNALSGLKAKIIDLSFIPLKQIEVGAFNNLSVPVTMILSGTFLTNLNFALEYPPGTFKRLEVEGSVMCDCEIAVALKRLACVLTGTCTRTDNSSVMHFNSATLRKYLDRCNVEFPPVTCSASKIIHCHNVSLFIFISLLLFIKILNN